MPAVLATFEAERGDLLPHGRRLRPGRRPVALVLHHRLAFNDIVLTHVRAEKADEEWELFYFTRVGLGHYNEILRFMERQKENPAIRDFIASLPDELQEAYRDTLVTYDANRAIANRLRNEAIFHYPDKSGVKAMRKALRNPELQDAPGGVTSSSGKVRDMRLHYADEVIAKMVMNAGGGSTESAGDVFAALSGGVSVFMQFANAVQDEFFVRKLG